MTSKTNTAEGGTNGVTATSANTGGGSGDALNVVLGTGTGAVFDSSDSAHGSLCYAVTGAASAKAELQMTGFTGTTFSQRFYVKLSALPSANGSTATIMQLFNVGSASICSWVINSSNQPVLQLSGSTVKTFTTITMNTSTWYRFEVQGTIGASTSTGVLNAQIYAGDSTSALDTFSTTTGNLGTTNLNFCSFGKESASSAFVATVRFDDIAMRDTTTTAWGVPATPPTASYSYSRAGLTLSVDGTASSAVTPATVSSYDWNWGDGTTHGTASTATHTYAAAGTYSVVLTVTDSNGLTGTQTQSIVISAPASSVTVESLTASSGWSASAGTLLGAITDGDPTTYDSPTTPPPTALEFDFLLQALTPPSTGQPLKVFLTMDATGAASASLAAQLYEGATLRSSLTGITIPSGSGPNVTGTVTLTFPWSDVQNVTTGGWNALKVKLQVTAA